MSHAGLYTCLVLYSDMVKETYIKLIVTANYSEPTVRYSKCSDKEEHCQVVCSSHGGYPRSKISWNVTGTEKPTRTPMWNILKSTEESDKDTMLFNVSSTASFNCSVMKHQNVSCSVDGVTSVFSICEVQTPKPSPVWPGVCAAAFVCLVLLAILISIPIYYCKCKKKKSSTIISSSNGILWSKWLKDGLPINPNGGRKPCLFYTSRIWRITAWNYIVTSYWKVKNNLKSVQCTLEVQTL